MDTTTPPTVRDLIAELAATEDVLRAPGHGTLPADRAVRHRQRELVSELRRRRRRS